MVFAVEGDRTDEIEIPVAVALYLFLYPCVEIVGAAVITVSSAESDCVLP